MIPTIFIRGSQCSIVGIDEEILKEIEEHFSYESFGFEYTDAFAEETWNGKQYVFRNRHFSIGLLSDVLSFLKQKQIIPIIKDFRQIGKRVSFQESDETFRPYQLQTIEDAIKNKASSVQIATGGGKTLIAAEFVRRLGLKTLVIVPTVEILKQMENTLTNHLQHPVGVVGNKQRDPDFITVATWQSLNERYTELIKSVDCLVIDEAQHIGPTVLRDIAKAIPATYRLGMSGTLFREDGADLEIIAACGPKIASYGYSYLIEHGYLVPARFWIVRVPPQRFAYYTQYPEVYKQYIVENLPRNEYIVNIADELVRAGRKVLVFVSRIEHGKKLEALGGEDFLYSSHPNRDELIDDFRYGKIKCLISTSVLEEGFDLPIIDALVLGSPTKSIIKTVQRIGRSLRIFENKKDAIIVDFADNCKFLDKHFQRRFARYREERLWKIEKTIDPNKEVEETW